MHHAQFLAKSIFIVKYYFSYFVLYQILNREHNKKKDWLRTWD